MGVLRTQVAIIGGGPAGLLLGQLLHKTGIETVLLERQSKSHVLSRIRAGVLEDGLVGLMTELGLDARLRRDGLVHDGTVIAEPGQRLRIDFRKATGAAVTVYGQTEVTRDLYDGRDASGQPSFFDVSDVIVQDVEQDKPSVAFKHAGETYQLNCDFVAGCDGFHGVSRKTIPDRVRQEFEKVYPFGWLGILSRTPPVHHELIYARSDRGFALCSQRNPTLSRYYIQCRLDDDPQRWSDSAFWDELRRRLPEEEAEALETGPSIEKSIAPLRSFVTEPMRWGRLFLCGDAAHIVPPTGAKGLNAAAADVHYLRQALVEYYQDGSSAGLDRYSEQALARVWKVERFSWWMTMLLHHFPEKTVFDHRMQSAELAFLRENEAAQAALAQNYVGLPY